jgi:hypothetical protein
VPDQVAGQGSSRPLADRLIDLPTWVAARSAWPTNLHKDEVKAPGYDGSSAWRSRMRPDLPALQARYADVPTPNHPGREHVRGCAAIVTAYGCTNDVCPVFLEAWCWVHLTGLQAGRLAGA